MASTVAKTNILYVYKNLLKMAKALPEAKREQSLRTIKEDFRKNMGELDPVLVGEMLIKANSTLGIAVTTLLISSEHVSSYSQRLIRL